MYSPRGEGVRQLLEQRLERSAHARYPSLASESDSPSVYSRSMLSPATDDHEELIRLPSHRTDRERLDDPTLSSLDLDSNPRYSFEEEESDSSDDDDQDDEIRMSVLGPSLRFHSPAPWEVSETQDSPASSYLSKMGLNFGSPSPRTSESSRPSGESSRSQPKSSKSMDTTSSQSPGSRGALRPLTQSFISSNSFISTHSSASRTKPSFGKIRSDMTDSSCEPSPLPSPSESSHHVPYTHTGRRPQFPYTSSVEAIDRANGSSPSEWSLSQSTEENLHPYANPRHALHQADRDCEPVSPLRTDYHSSRLMVSRSDSSVTITESPSNSSAATKVSVTVDTSTSRNVKARNRMSTIHGKEISSPIAIQSRNDVPVSPISQVSSIPGWTERGSSPTFTLISLEEAQAQAQRARSATAQPAMQTLNRSVVFPDSDDTNRVADTASLVTNRTRSRSISAGIRAKQVLTNIKPGPAKMERRDSELNPPPAPAKPLKHKKSGFMRLFNGREKETLPPVPPLSETHAAVHPAPLQKSATISSYRVPVPSLSSLEAPSEHGSLSPTAPSHTVLAAPSVRPDFSSSKRTPPPPIQTQLSSSSSSPRGNASRQGGACVLAIPDTAGGTSLSWNQVSMPPQSAPPHATEFPSLKLRPVSSAFSTQFASHILSPNTTEEDLDLVSPSTSRSPVTPGPPHRSLHDGFKGEPVSTEDLDQASLIQVLQEQILSAKKAWQLQICELEGQVKDLRAEVEEARTLARSDEEYCAACGRGQKPPSTNPRSQGVINRPRTHTGASSRFATTH